MKNKFLEKYPNLWIPKVGDKVEIVQILYSDRSVVCNPELWNYQIGDVAIIEKIRYITITIKLLKNGETCVVFFEEVSQYTHK